MSVRSQEIHVRHVAETPREPGVTFDARLVLQVLDGVLQERDLVGEAALALNDVRLAVAFDKCRVVRVYRD